MKKNTKGVRQMKFKQIIPYKLRRALSMATIAGATILPAACEKEVPEHDTTYVWGKHYWTEVWPADKVAASADSASVRYVYLLNDGKSFEGTTSSVILKQINNIAACINPTNVHKLQGKGTLHDIGIGQDKDVSDSVSLAKMGFKFGKVHYGSYDRHSYGR